MRPVVFDLLSGLELDGQKSLVGPVGRRVLGAMPWQKSILNSSML
jgi:hypothetical protein